MSAPSIERRVRINPPGLPVEVRDKAGTAGVLSGYGAVFYNAADPGTEYDIFGDGYVLERIDAGAFDRAIREDNVAGLVNHDPNLLLGRTKAGTMRLSVDAKGLRYEVDLADTQAGRDARTSALRGDLDGSSFSFSVDAEEWSRVGDNQVRTLKSVRLFDVGPVVFPAYTATTSEARAEMRSRIEKALPAPAPVVDNTHDRRARELDLKERE